MSMRELIAELNKLSDRKFDYGHDFFKGFFVEDITGITDVKDYIKKINTLERIYSVDLEECKQFFGL